MSIIPPDVETAVESHHLLSVCRCSRLVKRSVAAGYARLGYKIMPTDETSRTLNENIMLLAIIASGKGVELRQIGSPLHDHYFEVGI